MLSLQPSMVLRSGVLALALALVGTAKAASVDDCLALGFTDTLVCSQCDKMSEFVTDEGENASRCCRLLGAGCGCWVLGAACSCGCGCGSCLLALRL